MSRTSKIPETDVLYSDQNTILMSMYKISGHDYIMANVGCVK